MGLDLPEYVLEDPVIVALSNASNDLVAYASVLYIATLPLMSLNRWSNVCSGGCRSFTRR